MFFLPRSVKIALAAVLLSAGPAAAEMELSLYLGWQSTDDSTASGTLPGGVAFSRNIDWEAKPFEGPIYYGGRAIWWTERDFGFGLEGTHTKAYASAADLAALGLNRFELSDGNNIFTANAMKRWPGLFNGVNGAVGRGPDRGFTPYLGAGIGISVPNVDAQVVGSPVRTHEYQFGGVALRGIAGMKYEINDRWAVFGEYQITWSANDITIDPNPLVPGQAPGDVSTDVVTHAVNFGISFSF